MTASAPSLPSLDMATLAGLYAQGALTPSDLVADIVQRQDAQGDDHVWITKIPPDQMAARARDLEAMPVQQRAALPLWGIPFAIKDNIDAAGLPTTCACPDFARTAQTTAPVVQALIDAGGILVGKTNLDQFATGLVGVRSPYGTPRNPFDPAYIPGGSSSGSAVAVSSGLVSFALGTDTAGSGRVPAGFTNIVGLKPSRGLISTTGVTPACRSIDCVSILALTVEDAMTVLRIAGFPDAADPFSRAVPANRPALPPAFRFGVPRPDQLRFFGDKQAETIYHQSLERLEQLGGVRVEFDFAPFARAAQLLYDGPWVAERTAAVGDFIASHPGAALPVTESIILGGTRIGAVDAFNAAYAMEDCRKLADLVWNDLDVMALPTSGTIYRIDQVMADPVHTNSTLGIYTNFVNLLDMCGIAIPAGMRPDGLPSGLTLLAPAFREDALAPLAARFHRQTGLTLGATGHAQPDQPAPLPAPAGELIPLVVVGGHLAGQPLNYQLTSVGARLVGPCQTAACYRFYALPGSPARPGMVRVDHGGVAVAGEIWELAPADFARFTAAIPAPLGIGKVILADGRQISGFLCEPIGIDGAQDISSHGGWLAWLDSQATGH